MKTGRKATGRPSKKLKENSKLDRSAAKSQGSRAGKKRQRTSDIQFANIVEKMQEGFAALDRQMNYVYINQRGSELLKRKPEDLIGKNHWEEYPQAKNTSFGKAYLRALESQTPIAMEDYYAPMKIWLEKRIYPSEDGLSIFFDDVTERKRIEDEIRNVSRLPTENPNPVMRLTSDGKVLFANDSSVSLLKFWEQQNDQSIPEELRNRIAEAFASGSRKQIEIEHNERIFSCVLVPILEAGYVNFYGNDITEYKRAEEKLRESEEHLRLASQAAKACTWELNIQDQSYKLGDNFAEVIGFSADILPKNSTAVSNMINVSEDLPAIREILIQAVQTRSEVPPLQYRVVNPETEEIVWL